MTPGDIQIEGSELFYARRTDVRRAEKELGTAFPAGYADFIGRFGEGLLADFVRVYPPYQILEGHSSVSEWRKRIRKYWVWPAGRRVLTKKRALECVIVADTVHGDEVIFHPSDPDKLFVLPHEDEKIYVAGRGLWPALEWLMTSGVCVEPIADRKFEPFDGRAERAAEAADEPDRSTTDVVATEVSHHDDGRIVCRIFRLSKDHYSEPWEEGSALPVERAVIIDRAKQAAEAELGEPVRVVDEEIECAEPTAFYSVRCTPVADKGFGFHDHSVYLDLMGKVILPEEHSFTNQADYEKFEREL